MLEGKSIYDLMTTGNMTLCVLAILVMSFFIMVSEYKYKETKISYVLYFFFILFGQPLVAESAANEWQMHWWSVIYYAILIGGAVITGVTLGWDRKEDTECEYYYKYTIKYENIRVVVENEATMQVVRYLFWCYMGLLVIANVFAFCCYFNEDCLAGAMEFIRYHVIEDLIILGVIIAAFFGTIEWIRRYRYYKTAVITMSIGILVYAYVIASSGSHIIAFLMICGFYITRCIYEFRSKRVLLLCNALSILGIACMIPNINEEIIELVEGLIKLAESIGGLFVAAFYIFYLYAVIMAAKHRKYGKMYIIPKDNIKIWNAGKILGAYCVEWTLRDMTNQVWRFEQYEDATGVSSGLDDKQYAFAIEAANGWYYSGNGKKFEKWGEAKLPWNKEYKMPLWITILKDSEVNMLDEDSYVLKQYRRKYNGRCRVPVEIKFKAK